MARQRLLEQIEIRHEPRGQLGRFFLAAETALERYGCSIAIGTIADLTGVYEANQATWNGLVPILNSHHADVAPGTDLALVVRDRQGAIVASDAGRLIQLGARSVQESAEDLTLFYGRNAGALIGRHCCIMTAPSARLLCGDLLYHGGFWVRPDRRRSGLGSLLRELMRYIAVARWSFVHEFSVGAPAFASPDLVARYGFDESEPTVSFYIDDVPVMRDGRLLAVSRTRLLERLDRVIDERRRGDVADGDEKLVATR